MAQKRISDFFGGGPKSKNSASTSVVESGAVTISSEDSEHEEEEGLVELPPQPRGDGDPSSSSVQPGPSSSLPAAPAPAARATGSATMPSLAGHDKPFQPKDFDFPGRRFGKETYNRSVKPSWFEKWPWLHYVKESDCLVCFSCISAVEKKLIRQDVVRLDNTFVKGGFTNWRKSSEKFKEHERSDAHTRSVGKLSSLGRTPISAMLSNKTAEQQKTARNVLELLFRSIRFLGRKGVPFRGDTTRDGILYEYMLERTYNLPEESAWVRV